jgi:nitroreductase
MFDLRHIMSFLDLANKRSSVRGYDSGAVDESILNKVLEAGRIAPSAANQQPWHFIVVRDERQKLALKEAYGKEWFWKAPVIIVICVEPSKAWTRQDGKNYAAVDGAIAMDHITLCAADLGLGTCWVGAFDPAKVKNILGLPDGIEPLAMTPLGKPVAPSLPKKRKSMDQIVHYERW